MSETTIDIRSGRKVVIVISGHRTGEHERLGQDNETRLGDRENRRGCRNGVQMFAVPEDSAWIVARLYADAHADAVAAAEIIQAGSDGGLYAVALAPAHRDAILRHLDDCPEGLTELRGTLLRDNRDRLTSRRHRSDPVTVMPTTSARTTSARAMRNAAGA